MRENSSWIQNALTIDVEDYFQVSAFNDRVACSDWDAWECRVERNVDRILQLLSDSDSKATFFTLGWVASRYPEMVRRIVGAGHEIASHGFWHRRASDQSYAELLDDVSTSKRLIEDISGVEVRGYRAPSFSVGKGNAWAFEVLGEAGYSYSSSVYPVRHDHYGWESAPRGPFIVNGKLIEIPVSTVRIFGRNWPAGGGGYFRLLPYRSSRWAIDRINRIEGKPAVFYLHPWEIDPSQPRLDQLRWKTRFRHYVNLKRTERRLARLVKDFRWGTMNAVFLTSDRPAISQSVAINTGNAARVAVEL